MFRGRKWRSKADESAMVAALPSPVATKGRTFRDESVNAVKGMAAEAEFSGKELKYVYSGEMGGGNTMLPLYAAWKNGLAIIDTDGNGRAVPELNTGLLPVHKIPTSPVILASELGDTIVGRTEDPMDSKACENIARYMCQAYNQGIGFAAWMMNKADHLKASALGQMSLAEKTGEILRNNDAETAFEKMNQLVAESGRTLNVFVPSGTITDITIDSVGGFDTGVTTIKGDNGREYKVTFQNENLFVEEAGGDVKITVPHIISTFELKDGKAVPVSNSETYVGQKVALVSLRAHDRWYDEEECYGCWENILISAGYAMAKPQICED